MVGKVSVGIGSLRSSRTGHWIGCRAAIGLALACASVQATPAAECPGHPNAIGTSRTIVVDPREHPRIGTMQYPETLPLRDHEVVLTFDDGPLPRNSNRILQTLSDQCAKATFFLIGQQARAYPDGVGRLAATGHSIGTHSQNHPLTFEKMSVDKVRQEVDQGIASVSAALPDPSAVAPFFRIPGLLRAQNVEDHLASKGIQVWSTDFLADDWRHVSSARVAELAIKRLEAKHKGILLLHDIHARTVAALPIILHEMKMRGYHIVHVVPATPNLPATPTEPEEWRTHPLPEAVPETAQLRFPTFVFAEAERLIAQAPPYHNTPDGKLMPSGEPFGDGVKRPIQGVPAPAKNAASLPAPSETIFELAETTQASPLPTAAVRAGVPASQTARRAMTETSRPPYEAHAISRTLALSKRAKGPLQRVAHDVQAHKRLLYGGAEAKQPTHTGKSA
ncbi:MAG: polysaccharide deacetylase family protein, partial [Bradyrhizobium sp.]|nr:polysaccharide deacetylase family protein [Bradyrhizobium sp.]